MAQLTGAELLRISTTFWVFELATRGTRETITSTWRELKKTERAERTWLYMAVHRPDPVWSSGGCVFSPTEPRAHRMELDHVDLRVVPTCWRVGAALHFLLLQVRGHVVVREEHGLQLAHIRQGGICGTQGVFFSEEGSGSFTIPFFTKEKQRTLMFRLQQSLGNTFVWLSCRELDETDTTGWL